MDSALLDFISKYFVIFAGVGGAAGGYIQLRGTVKDHERRLNEVEQKIETSIDRVEDKIDSNHKELMGYVVKLAGELK